MKRKQMIKKETIIIFIIAVIFPFCAGCSVPKEDLEREINEIYHQNYITHRESSQTNARMEQELSKDDNGNKNDRTDKAGRLQMPEGYSNLCGIWTSGNGTSITGNVKIYGGVYTRGVLLLGNGAVINTDNAYLYGIDNNIDLNNPEIFKGLTGLERPFSMNNVPRNVRLINVSEEEVTPEEYEALKNP